MAIETMAIDEDHPFSLSKSEEKKHSTQGETQVSRKERRKVDSRQAGLPFSPKPYPA